MSKKNTKKTEHSPSGGSDVATEERVVTRSPKPYKVLLLNDDYTTMDFVVSILESVFRKTPSEAVRIMLQVHHQGAGICGIFPKQIAETKVKLVHEKARAAGFPLCCAMEEA